ISGLQHLTATGDIIGTPIYMSPERIKGEEYDGKADVYSLGVMLYEMIAGRPPFTSKQGIQVLLEKLVYERPQPLGRYNPNISMEVEEVIMRALSKEPGLRPTPRE